MAGLDPAAHGVGALSSNRRGLSTTLGCVDGWVKPAMTREKSAAQFLVKSRILCYLFSLGRICIAPRRPMR